MFFLSVYHEKIIFLEGKNYPCIWHISQNKLWGKTRKWTKQFSVILTISFLFLFSFFVPKLSNLFFDLVRKLLCSRIVWCENCRLLLSFPSNLEMTLKKVRIKWKLGFNDINNLFWTFLCFKFWTNKFRVECYSKTPIDQNID